MFVDQVSIKIKAGNGGNGIVAWERQKYVPKGGPAGGDGGKGGDIIFVADKSLNTLVSFASNKFIKAESGTDGQTHKKRGKSGSDTLLKVPTGTLVWDEEKNQLIADLEDDGSTVTVAYGGDGGYGNAHFASSVRQAPEIAELGEPGEEKQIRLELKLIADVGLVGLPNVGKSTLLSVVTKAKPKIANYPFTTIVPNLGVVEKMPDGSVPEGFGFVIADIPGLIKGAAEGKGLGDEFLRHVERTRVLIHIIDAVSNDFFGDFSQINEELKIYNPELTKKPMIIAVSRADAVIEDDLKEKIEEFKVYLKDTNANLETREVYAFSGVARTGLRELLFATNEILKKYPKEEKEKIEDFKEYTITDRVSGYEVFEEDGVLRVEGTKIEKFAVRTDFNNVPAMYRFRHILKRMGIESALRRLGAKEGRKIEMLDKAFDFKEF
jgi:GTP-binding protein